MLKKDFLQKIIKLLIEEKRAELLYLLEKEQEKARKQQEYKTTSELRSLINILRRSLKHKPSTFQLSSTKFNDKLLTKLIPSRGLKDIVLTESNTLKITNFIREWKLRDKLLLSGLEATNKLLLFGPPGTGKSLLAEVLAKELNLELVVVNLDEIISSFLGNTGKNIREAFEEARSKNILLLIEELDTLGKKRDDNNEIGELKRVVTVLLQNIDRFSQNSILIATTNHQELLDNALWRRFDLVVEMQLPKLKSRSNLLSKFFVEYKKSLNIEEIAKYTNDLSGAELRQIYIQSTKDFILNNFPVSNTTVLKNIINIRLMKSNKKRKEVYQIAQELLKDNYTVKEISKITDIPYTTLKDNLSSITKDE